MSRNVNRRQFVVGASAATVAAGAFGAADALAQENATPEAEDSAIDQSATPAAEPAPLPTIPPEIDGETNWSIQGQNFSNTREAKGSGISSETVGTLGLAWSVSVDNAAAYGSLVASPIVVDGRIYLQDAMSNVFVLDLETGEEIWSHIHNLDVPSGGPNGIAVAYGNVYYTIGGPADVLCVTASTGEELWRTNLQGPLREGITMAPVVHDGSVYVSTIPGAVDGFYQGGQRGIIYALDAATGAVIWYFDTTTDNLWGNARVNSGGGLWHPPAIDEHGHLFAGIGNAGPFPGTEEYPNATSRPGDNDYANSLLSIDPSTASLNWYINIKPHDLFDLDNQLSPILATVEIDGAERNIVMSAGKHGLVVAADRETGEELWRTPVGQHNGNADLQEIPEGEESTEVLPGVLGGVETPMAYSNGVVFAPVLNLPTYYFPHALDAAKMDLFGGTGELVAVNAATGEILWSAEIPSGVFGAAVVANDVVFTGALDGVIRGYNVADGTPVWTAQAPAGLNAPFAISGDYLLVPAGGLLAPSADTVEPAPERAPALLAFKLGTASAEATPTA